MFARELSSWSYGRPRSSRQSSYVPCTITYRGRNSQGNRHETRTQPGGLAYYYSSRDGRYYYRNSDGSLYYNRGNEFSTNREANETRYDRPHYTGNTGNGYEADEFEQVEETEYEARYLPVGNEYQEERRFQSYLYENTQESFRRGSTRYSYEVSYQHDTFDYSHDERYREERRYCENGRNGGEGIYEEEPYVCEAEDQAVREYVEDNELEEGDYCFDYYDDDDGESNYEGYEYDYEDDGRYEDEDYYYDYSDR